MSLPDPRTQVGPRLGALSTLLVGDTGVGKTSQAARWPSPVVFNLERGTDLLSGVVPMYDVNEHFRTLKDLETLIEKLAGAITRGNVGYRTVLLDGLTRFVRQEAQGRSNENMLHLYRDISLTMGRILDTVLGAGVLVVATGHTRERIVRESNTFKEIEVVPDFSQAVAKNVMELFDIVLYCYFDEKGTRRARTQPVTKTMVKREKVTGVGWTDVTYQYTYKAKSRGNAFREDVIPLKASTILTSLKNWGEEQQTDAQARRQAEAKLKAEEQSEQAVGGTTPTNSNTKERTEEA